MNCCILGYSLPVSISPLCSQWTASPEVGIILVVFSVLFSLYYILEVPRACLHNCNSGSHSMVGSTPRPIVLHPPPCTLHPPLSTLHSPPSTLHSPPSTLHPLLAYSCNFNANNRGSKPHIYFIMQFHSDGMFLVFQNGSVD